jgi:hypothetical protein
MQIVGQILQSIGGLGAVVCFILVIVQMFQRKEATMGIVCLVLLCCGVGTVVAFIYGWIKNREWQITNVMYAWTACWILLVIGYALYPIDVSDFTKLPMP